MNAFGKSKRRGQINLNLVPVMDMLTAIIFFLLLSTTFMEFTKLPVPPSGVKTISDNQKQTPVAPELFIDLVSSGEVGVLLKWGGDQPGRVSEKVPFEKYSLQTAYPLLLKEKLDALIQQFSKKYPNEKTIQIGFGEKISYRMVVASMDAVLPLIPDIVLLSYLNTPGGMN